jgi:hypothetical protein
VLHVPCLLCAVWKLGTHACRSLTGALTHRFIALLSSPTGVSHPQLDPHNVATWLFMYASLRHYDATLLDAVSAYAARHPAARFRSLSALSTALWAHARLGTHPSRFLDLCHLSAAHVLPVGQPASAISFQVSYSLACSISTSLSYFNCVCLLSAALCTSRTLSLFRVPRLICPHRDYTADLQTARMHAIHAGTMSCDPDCLGIGSAERMGASPLQSGT